MTIEIPCANTSCKKPVVIDGAAFYWTPRGYEEREVYCPNCDLQFNAPLIKPQPRSTNTDPALEGWI